MKQAKSTTSRRRLPRVSEPTVTMSLRLPVTIDNILGHLSDQEHVTISGLAKVLIYEALVARGINVEAVSDNPRRYIKSRKI